MKLFLMFLIGVVASWTNFVAANKKVMRRESRLKYFESNKSSWSSLPSFVGKYKR
jgi:hypothetical protein